MAAEKSKYRFNICVNPIAGSHGHCCGKKGSVALAERIEEGVKTRLIDVEIKRIICMNKCHFGPSMRLAPGGEFYLGVTEADIPALLDMLEETAGNREPDEEHEPLYPGA